VPVAKVGCNVGISALNSRNGLSLRTGKKSARNSVQSLEGYNPIIGSLIASGALVPNSAKPSSKRSVKVAAIRALFSSVQCPVRARNVVVVLEVSDGMDLRQMG
jgi:hypothetical protein